jgi:hypothetical protein
MPTDYVPTRKDFELMQSPSNRTWKTKNTLRAAPTAKDEFFQEAAPDPVSNFHAMSFRTRLTPRPPQARWYEQKNRLVADKGISPLQAEAMEHEIMRRREEAMFALEQQALNTGPRVGGSPRRTSVSAGSVAATMPAQNVVLHKSDVDNQISLDVEEDEDGAAKVRINGILYTVKWIGTQSPDVDNVTLASLDKRFAREVVLSNGSIFENPLDHRKPDYSVRQVRRGSLLSIIAAEFDGSLTESTFLEPGSNSAGGTAHTAEDE